MSTLKTPFRYDFVGSFLRPEKLKAAKKAFEEGTITQEELDHVTDECVTEIVAKQKVAGYHAITENSGIWILCGDLKELPMKKMVAAYSLTERWQTLRLLIWWER